MKREAARNAEIIRRRLDRQTFREIADAMRMTPFAVRRICERMDVRKPPPERIAPPRPAPLSAIEKDAIRYRRERGESLASLMECFEIGKITVKRVISEGADA